jgi:pyruvate/2-oxoglutarate dehydrogenase complex dihydrolipoamide dehydrogenase (E3) component
MKFDYDLIIIGGGSAGLSAADTSLIFGKKVAMVAIDRLGGDCLWTGCVPSKALLHSARENRNKDIKDPQKLYDLARRDIDFAWDKIQKDHDNPKWYQDKGIDVYLERAEFVDPHTVKIGEKNISAKYFLIATGSRALKLPVPGIEEVEYLTNEDLFTLKKVPKSLIIMGGGPIGCEMGQAFTHLGVKVSIVQKGDRLIPKDEIEASDVLTKKFKSEGIEVFFNSETIKVGENKGVITLSIKQDGKEFDLKAEGLLMAVGRQPVLEKLGLEKIGVSFNEKGISHNPKLQTNLSHIYVSGDIAGDYQFTHFAGYQAAVAVRNIFLPIRTDFKVDPISWCTFTDPEISHTGLSEIEAKKENLKFRIIMHKFEHIDRAVSEGEIEGFIKIIVGKSNKILGATIVGQRAGEMIHELALAVKEKMSTDQLLGLMHIYPTYSLGIQQALFNDFLKSDTKKIKLARLLSKLI